MDDDIDLEQETGITRRFVVITIEEGEDPEVEGLENLSPTEISGLGQFLKTQAFLMWTTDEGESL